MKKLLLIILAVTLIFTFVSCDDIFTTGTENNQESTDDIELNTHEKTTNIVVDDTLVYETLEEYKRFVELNPFLRLRYEAIEHLGEFSSFSYLGLRSYEKFEKIPFDMTNSHNYIYELNDGQIRIEIHQSCSDWGRSFNIKDVEANMHPDLCAVFEENELTYREQGLKKTYQLTFSSESNELFPGHPEPEFSIFYNYNDNGYLDSMLFYVIANADKSVDNIKLHVNITFGENGLEGYDFSNEELNGFLYADTAGDALAKAHLRVLHFMDEEKFREGEYSVWDEVLQRVDYERVK